MIFRLMLLLDVSFKCKSLAFCLPILGLSSWVLFSHHLHSLNTSRSEKAMVISFFSFFSLGCLALVGATTAQEDCKPAQCQRSGPVVRFPFWLKGYQPRHCGYPHPVFELSCSPSNTIELGFQHLVHSYPSNIKFPLQMNVLVQDLDYESQLVHLFLPVIANYCLPNQLPTAVKFSSDYPLKLHDDYTEQLSLFNCSSVENIEPDGGRWLISCLSGHGYQVIALPNLNEIWNYDLASCTKMFDITDFPEFNYGLYSLQWSKPSCRYCEAQGKYCRLKNDGRDDATECFDIPIKPRKGASKKLVIAVVMGTLFLFLATFIVSSYVISLKKKKDDQKKIEKFLDDYKALRPTRFSYADIKKTTDQFKDKLGEGGYGTVYKGNLSNDIVVAVKVLNNFKGNGEEFINEVGTIGRIHHINVVRLVGYCADGYKRALLYEFLPNGTLEELISSRNQINSLGWEKLQQIAIGIAKGLDYLHQGCNQRILHFDIKPENILLDHNFNPKVADFGLAKLCSKDQSAVSMTAARGTIGYIAPEVFSRNFGNVSYKSDVYSFGMLLLDMVGGRKRFQARIGDSSQMCYPEWMYKQLEKGEEIEIQIDKEEERRIVKKLSIVGLWCIQWCPADRPSMKLAIQMLEGENMPAMPPNPFAAAESKTAFTGGSCSLSHTEIICSISD